MHRGKVDHETRVAHCAAAYVVAATSDGEEKVVFPSEAPNGIGLSPDGSRLYAAETHTGRVYAWNVTAPGEVEQNEAGAAGAATSGGTG